MRRFGAGIALALFLLAMASCGLQLTRAGATTYTPGLKTQNSTGAIGYKENPFIYIAGAVTDVDPVGSGQVNLLLTLKPLGTYELYSEQLLICGAPVEMFEQKVNPVVLTVTRSAPRVVDGRGCHQLIRVDNMEKQ